MRKRRVLVLAALPIIAAVIFVVFADKDIELGQSDSSSFANAGISTTTIETQEVVPAGTVIFGAQDDATEATGRDDARGSIAVENSQPAESRLRDSPTVTALPSEVKVEVVPALPSFPNHTLRVPAPLVPTHIASLMANEARDSAWADVMEGQLQVKIGENGGDLLSFDVECRSTMCGIVYVIVANGQFNMLSEAQLRELGFTSGPMRHSRTRDGIEAIAIYFGR